jgi:hypothetical protein
MGSRHSLSFVYWRVAFRLAGDGSLDCRGEAKYQRLTTTPDAIPGPCGAWRESSRSTGCEDEVFLLQPPDLLRGRSRALYVFPGRSFHHGIYQSMSGRNPARTPDEIPPSFMVILVDEEKPNESICIDRL